MTYPVKIEFLEYADGFPVNWNNAADWSEYLSEAPTINRRVESENEGEAGVIVFDNASISLRYDTGNAVYSVFSQDLSEKQRFLFRISATKSDKTYEPLFEGMADFSTITWPGDQDIISFEIVDKLSALGVLKTPLARSKDTLTTRFLEQVPASETASYFLDYELDPGAHVVYLRAYNSSLPPFDFDLDTPLLLPGELLSIPFMEGSVLSYYEDCIVKKVEIVIWPDTGKLVNKVTVYHTFDSEGIIRVSLSDEVSRFYHREVYDVDINIISSDTLQAIDGLEFVKAIYSSAWPGAVLYKKPAGLSFNVPLEYALRVIDENPLGSTPLDALKTLADSLKCYMFINREGHLVIQRKADLAENGTARTLATTKKISSEKKYFWDKLIDGVEITVKSWVQNDEGEYIEGNIVKSLQLPDGSHIKPKNQITKKLLAGNSSINTKEALDQYASDEADVYLEFYGKRRSSYDIQLHLDDNTILWELVDNITIDSVQYFFTALEIDLVEKIVALSLAEITGHDYDFRQIVVELSEENSLSVSSGGSGFSGTSIVTQEKGIVYVG